MKWVGPNALHLHVTHIKSRNTTTKTRLIQSECIAEKLQTAVSTHSRKQYYPHLHIKWMFYRFNSLVLSASNWVIWSCMNLNTKQKPVYFAVTLLHLFPSCRVPLPVDQCIIQKKKMMCKSSFSCRIVHSSGQFSKYVSYDGAARTA